MACFVIGSVAALFFAHHHGFALGTHHHLVLGVFEFRLGDHALVAARRQKGRFVAEVGKVGTGEAGRATGNDLWIDIRSQRLVLHVDLAGSVRGPSHQDCRQ